MTVVGAATGLGTRLTVGGLTFQVRYWMIGVGDVRLSMSVFDVGWMQAHGCVLMHMPGCVLHGRW